MVELEKLYIVRNEAAKAGDIETVNNITEELNNLYPVKPKPVLCIDGKPVQFEIVGCADADIVPTDWKGMSAEFIETYYAQGNTGSYKEGNRLASYIHNGLAKVPFKRILIKKLSTN